MEYIEGKKEPFQAAKERKALVGKLVRYLRNCDIDRSGRGYYFPRIGFVTGAYGRYIEIDGNPIMASEMKEIVIVP